ncbi:MAG: M17 family peptidase N-terminal domain-containing protein [Candidatus Lernaella stagnicola]|nr:M17 family peptidase N-terminal domain-containing protein [Candidatus Lernaella stagnicola]
MKLRGTSQRSDQVPTDTLVLSFFKDERPLKGATGLSDWHLSGRISRLIMQHFVDGTFGEPLLMPALRRMPCDKIMVAGLGRRENYTIQAYRTICKKICEALAKLNVTDFALELPGVALSELDAAEAAEILGNAIAERFGGDKERLARVEVTVFAERRHLKIINPILARLERSLG